MSTYLVKRDEVELDLFIVEKRTPTNYVNVEAECASAEMAATIARLLNMSRYKLAVVI